MEWASVKAALVEAESLLCDRTMTLPRLLVLDKLALAVCWLAPSEKSSDSRGDSMLYKVAAWSAAADEMSGDLDKVRRSCKVKLQM